MYNNVGCVVINFLRPYCTIKCIDSLLQQTPDIQIYLGDQDQNSVLANHYTLPNIHYFQLPYDCGISYSRNTLINQIVKDGCDYFMWIDNDFVFDNTLNLDHPIKILKTNRKIGVVGGSVKKDGVMGHYERFMYYDAKRGILTYVPIEITHPEERDMEGIKYFDCDITFNFCVAKKEIWTDKRIRWPEEIFVKFEHSSFFLRLQKYSTAKVVYCPSFSVNHVHVGSKEYQTLRNRMVDEISFSKIFNLKCMFEVGGSGRDFINSKPSVYTPKTFEKDKPIVYPNPIIKQEPKFTSQLDLLLSNNLSPILLNESCLKAIQKKQINKEYFGFNTKEKLKKAIELTDDKDYELYTLPTKNIAYQGKEISVPSPVVPYLIKLYGKDWIKL